MLDKLYCSLMGAKAAFVKKLSDEKGSHIVEIVIFIAIAVGLAFIFKDKIAELLDQIFNKSKEAVDTLSGP